MDNILPPVFAPSRILVFSANTFFWNIKYYDETACWMSDYPSGRNSRPALLGPRLKAGWGKFFMTSRWAPKVAFWLRFKTGQILEQ